VGPPCRSDVAPVPDRPFPPVPPAGALPTVPPPAVPFVLAAGGRGLGKRKRDADDGTPAGPHQPRIWLDTNDIVAFNTCHPTLPYYPVAFGFTPASSNDGVISSQGPPSEDPPILRAVGVLEFRSEAGSSTPTAVRRLRPCCPMKDAPGYWVVASPAIDGARRLYILDVNETERRVLAHKLAAAFDIVPQTLAPPVDLCEWMDSATGEGFTQADFDVLSLLPVSPPLRRCIRMNGFDVACEQAANNSVRYVLRGLSQTLGIAGYSPNDLRAVCRALRLLAAPASPTTLPDPIPLAPTRSPAAVAFFHHQARQLVERHQDQKRSSADVEMVLAHLPLTEPPPLRLLHQWTMRPLPTPATPTDPGT